MPALFENEIVSGRYFFNRRWKQLPTFESRHAQECGSGTATRSAKKLRCSEQRSLQLPPQKFSHQRPDEIGKIGLIAIRLGGGKAMVAEVKVVPFE